MERFVNLPDTKCLYVESVIRTFHSFTTLVRVTLFSKEFSEMLVCGEHRLLRIEEQLESKENFIANSKVVFLFHYFQNLKILPFRILFAWMTSFPRPSKASKTVQMSNQCSIWRPTCFGRPNPHHHHPSICRIRVLVLSILQVHIRLYYTIYYTYSLYELYYYTSLYESSIRADGAPDGGRQIVPTQKNAAVTGHNVLTIIII